MKRTFKLILIAVSATLLFSCSTDDLAPLYVDNFTIVNESSYEVRFLLYWSLSDYANVTDNDFHLVPAASASDGSDTWTYTHKYYSLDEHQFVTPSDAYIYVYLTSNHYLAYFLNVEDVYSVANACYESNWVTQGINQTVKGSRTGKKDDTYEANYTFTLTDSAVAELLAGDADYEYGGDNDDEDEDEDPNDYDPVPGLGFITNNDGDPVYVSEIVATRKSTDVFDMEFGYNDDRFPTKATYDRYSRGIWFQYDPFSTTSSSCATFKFNSSGYAKYMYYHVYSSGITTSETTYFSYDGEGHLTKIKSSETVKDTNFGTTNTYTYNHTGTFTWENGDMTSATVDGTTYEVTYSARTLLQPSIALYSVFGNAMEQSDQLEWLCHLGFFGVGSVHEPASCNGTAFKSTFNEDGTLAEEIVGDYTFDYYYTNTNLPEWIEYGTCDYEHSVYNDYFEKYDALAMEEGLTIMQNTTYRTNFKILDWGPEDSEFNFTWDQDTGQIDITGNYFMGDVIYMQNYDDGYYENGTIYFYVYYYYHYGTGTRAYTWGYEPCTLHLK